MGDEDAPTAGYFGIGGEGEGERNDANERHGKGLAVFTNGDK